MKHAAWCCLLLSGLGCGEDEPAPSAERWPQFGRDNANTRANLAESSITPSTVGGLVPRWTVPLPGCTATPAVVDDIVYVGDWDGTMHALRIGDGSAAWSVKATEPGIDASPLVDGDRIFVGDASGDFFALDRASGAELWRVHLDEHPSTHIFSSAVAVEGMVLVGVAGTELIGIKDDYTFRGSLVALDAASGAERWRVYMTENDATSGGGVSVWSSVAIDAERKLAFVGTGNTYEPPASPRADAVVAVDYTTGEVRWVRQLTVGDVYTIFQPPPQGPDADVGAPPNLFSIDGRDVVGVGDKAGVYSVLDRDSGETVWAIALEPGSHLGGVMNAAAVARGVIYVTTNHFTLEIGAEALDEPDPRNTHTTFALRASDGAVLWQVTQPYPSVGGLSYAGGVVYHGSVDGTLHAMDAVSGEQLWMQPIGSSLASGSSLVNGQLYTSFGFRFFLGSGPIEGGLTAWGL